ncbi:MAG: methyl-accepting chemotaxis protein, partial [Bacteroidales bacterium]|nr:methyl-accepting chemotaxis protein [Bacteroidales bacterium]
MKKFLIGTKIAIAFSVVLILLVAIALITFYNLAKIEQDNSWVVHTQDVLHTINSELSDLQDAETGQRGFLITGRDHYLDPYHAGVTACFDHLKQLKQLTSDNPAQQQNCIKLESLIPQKLDELAQTIDLRKSTGFEAALAVVLTDRGKKVMDDIRTVLDDMTKEENRLFDKRTLETASSQKAARIPIYIVLIVAFIIIVLLTIFLTRNIAFPLRRIALIADQIATGNVENKITIFRKDEIGKLADSFRRMQSTLEEKTNQAKEISEGNLMIDVQPLSEKDAMGHSFKTMVDKLRNQLNEINQGINVLASSSSEIMASVTQLASSSAETATSVGETTTTVEEVKQTAELSNQKAKAVSENAVKTAEISAEGTRTIANTIEGMNKIRQQMTAIAGMVVRLSEQSQTIG